jgi:hypothetical protein
MRKLVPVLLILAVGCLLPQSGLTKLVQWSSADGGNDHWYEVVYVPAGIQWDEAKTDAENAYNKTGYLATATLAAENNFIFSLVSDSKYWVYWHHPTLPIYGLMGPWLGGYQTAEGIEPASGWKWVSGEPWGFTAWFTGGPDDLFGGTQDYLHFYNAGGLTPKAEWNDARKTSNLLGYISEFNVYPAPLPDTGLLLGTGLVGLVLYCRRKLIEKN